MTQHLLKGDKLFDKRSGDVTQLVIDPMPLAGRIKLLDLRQNMDVYVEYEQLRQDIAAGTITVQRTGAPEKASHYRLDPRQQDELAAALDITRRLQEYAGNKGISFRQAYSDLKAEHDKHPEFGHVFPSLATVYRHLNRHRQGLPLLFSNSNKGNRSPRHSEQVESVVIRMVEHHLLQPQSRWSLTSVLKLVNQLLHDEHLIPVDEQVSKKYVRRILSNLTSDPQLDRMDPRTAAAAKSIAKHPIRVSAPLMRVEQDALHLPWRLQTPDGHSTSIHLVHAIDCYTGMPVGWHLVVGSPTVSDSLQCVQSILFSKKERFAALGMDGVLDCYGTPSLLVFDNGPETKGERMQKLTHLGIDPKHCKARHAQGKPYIERLNRSLKEALETLPGCTRFDGVDGQRKPEELEDLPMSLQEFERWIVRWYYEEWANTELKRHVRSIFTETTHLGNTPAQRWRTITQEHEVPLPLPPSIRDWQMTLYERTVRGLSRKTGITYEGYSFRGPRIPYLLKKYGEESIEILVDPEDFRRIYIQDGPDGELVELINHDVDETTPAYSFAQAKKMVQEAAGRTPEEIAQVAAFRRDLFLRSTETSAKASKPSKKSVEESRETARRSKETSALNRARDNPLPPPMATPSAESTNTILSAGDVPTLPVLDRKTRKTIL